ncbi:tetratricopeptide repeat (TPR)-like superfamily protein [Actinidia rufa]|uniref:Tetratricopeptide repeat (TPR)-like superfamily protein n=1 Tax=Actinidia rufa TaxID=165716 RepID=A0A7J0DSE3_9ERIC|nr:tetratricopeptide repeat (TPR)-like superfamily protein [Actinidia rufa]
MSSSIAKRTISSLSPPPPPPPTTSETLVSAVVSILKHHRSKSRWTQILSLYPTGFTPSASAQITLRLRNTPHLALRFFLFTLRRSLCPHSLLSYSALIHTLSRSRLKSQTLTLIQSALRKFSESPPQKTPKLFETLVKTYREYDSAPFVFELLIKACLRSNRVDEAIEITRMLRSRGIFPTVRTCNSLIRSVLRCRGCYAGYDLYKEVFGFDGEVKSSVGVGKIVPNVHTFNVIMLGSYQDGVRENVEEIWEEMGELGCEPNAYSYSILMAGYCEDGKMGEAVILCEEMGIKGVKPDAVVYNTMIGGFCRIGEVGRAEELFREMGLSGLESSCVTFEHLIIGYCKIGDVDSAILVYKDMCRRGLRPESLTVDAVVGGLCEEKRVSEALEFLGVAMRKHEMVPKRKSYEVLIKGLCQEARVEEALKLQAEMVGKGFEPNLEIYNAFIDASMKEENNELAEMLKKEMLETQMGKEED